MSDICQDCAQPLNAAGYCPTVGCPGYLDPAQAQSAVGRPVAAPVQSSQGDEAQLATLKALQDQRLRGENDFEFVTICGFPTAGKSWLTPRIEDVLTERRGWSADMDDSESPGSAMERKIGTKSMGQTRGLLIHSLDPGHGQQGTSIKLIDIPGERLRQLIESTDDAGLPASLLAALALADRIVLTLPSDVCIIGTLIHRDITSDPDLASRKRRVEEINQRDEAVLEGRRNDLADELRAMRDAGEAQTSAYAQLWAEFETVSVNLSEKRILDQWEKLALFARKIRRVMGRAAFIATRIGRDKFLDLPPERWLEGYSTQYDNRPVALTQGSYAVLTKADRVLPLLTDMDHCDEWDFLPERTANREAMEQSGWRDALAPYIGDPRLLCSIVMPELVSQLDGWFPNLRYDWASADWQGGDWSIELDITHPHKGIEPLCDWLVDGAPAITASPRSIASVAKLRRMIEGRHAGKKKGAKA